MTNKNIDQLYADWKNWGNPTALSKSDTVIWDKLHGLINLKPHQRLLELGFGQGSHLSFCQSKGVSCFGIEQNSVGVELARKAGLNVIKGELSDFTEPDNSLDVIVAMDVIEHIPLDQLIPMMQKMRALLKPEGALLLTFPNGGSPFGRLQQHGDLTHINTFNRLSLEQLAMHTGFHVSYYGNYPEYFPLTSPKQILKAPIRLFLRWFIRLCVKAYYNEPLGLAAVGILKKT